MRSVHASLGVALALSLAGCAGITAADKALRTDPVARLAPAGEGPWRADLGDPVLAPLLHRADLGALDVKLALTRLEKAKADVAAIQAGRGLRVDVGAEAAAGGRTLHHAGSAATPTLEASYEVDLWGRLRKTRDAMVGERTAAAFDVTAARLAIAAETVRAYVAMRLAEAQREVAVHRRDLAVHTAGLVAQRHAEGAAGSELVARSRIAAAETEAAVQWQEEERGLQLERLGDLIGDPTLALPWAGSLAAADPASPVSSDAVDGRPDIQAALARLQAADARRGAAVAAARPQFMISAMLGAADANIATLLDARTLAWALAASITHTVLDGGANRARIDGASAEADTADLAYRKTVLTAWAELRAAVVGQDRAQRDASLAQAAVNDADLELQTGERRHQEGLVDGVGLAELQDARELATARVQAAQARRLEARVQLALATGGQ
ncbi:MAG: hypothetical protein JWO33_1340 [Caulobacteraceae bacterium]|nr:hypothetical protein [Caulobacteraceae bacterium]